MLIMNWYTKHRAYLIEEDLSVQAFISANVFLQLHCDNDNSETDRQTKCKVFSITMLYTTKQVKHISIKCRCQ